MALVTVVTAIITRNNTRYYSNNNKVYSEQAVSASSAQTPPSWLPGARTLLCACCNSPPAKCTSCQVALITL